MPLKYFLLFSFIFFECGAKIEIDRERLGALWNLERMSECRLQVSALKYNNYGCWCGVGGSGEPVDEIDRCCMNHDHCYDYLVDKSICVNVPEEYVFDYSWSCSRDRKIICSEIQNECQKYLCWCDRTVVECWHDYQIPPPETKSCQKQSMFGNITAKQDPFSINTEAYNKMERRKKTWNGMLRFVYSAWLFIPTRIFGV